nr:PREDICTED: rho GTPase-activating protein 25 [Anolis carolinensis]|eukprot:XP_008123814.1 PREDICTED: rho GTPase-activating protein 25 [Anolis carolinensis]
MSLKLPRSWDFGLRMDKIVRSQSVMALEAKGPVAPGPLKAGWLKKQRSIVRNWQQRYFVLQGPHLYYFKDQDDLKPQGLVHLQGSSIREVASSSDEAGKFIFEIIPGISGDPSRAGPDSCVLMAASQSDLDEWVKLLRRAVGSALGVVFGQQLAETMAYEQRFGPHLVPILVEKCAGFIRDHGLREEGIFRLPGQDNLVKQLRDAFDAGERPSFGQDTDVHTVASLLKLYLRELPEPVVPRSQYEDFLLCGQILAANETKGGQLLVKQLGLLPRDNYNLLSYICRFLHEIDLCSATNKMSVENLATVFGVNLIRPKVEDPVTIMKGTPQIQRVVAALIRGHERFFPPSKDQRPPLPQQANDPAKNPGPRNAVGWDAVPFPAASGSGTLWEARDDGEPSGRGPSAEGHGELPARAAPEPRKRTQTLPNRKCFGTVPGLGENDIFRSSFWTSSSSLAQLHPVPSSAGRSHKRTFSHGLSRLLHLPHAENPSAQETGKPVREAERPLTPGSHYDPGKGPDPDPEQNGSPDPPPNPDRDFCDSEDPDSLRKRITELERELEAQKKDYEEQMASLEKENYEVWAKLVRLKEELEKEKARSAETERTLQEVRGSRDDLEKTNRLLEESLKAVIRSGKNH